MQPFNQSLFERFLQIEEENNAFDIKIDGIPIWERLRFNLFRRIRQQQNNMDGFNYDKKSTTDEYINGIRLLLKNVVIKNPYLAKQHDYLFYGKPRRKLLEDGKWWDIYCDPIYDQTSIDYLHVEDHYQMEHKSPVKTDNLRYNDLIWFTGAIKRNLGLVDVTLSSKDKKRLDRISSVIKQEFDVEVDIARRAEVQLTERASVIGLYEKFLRKINPKVAIVGFGDRNIKEACYNLNIPTVRLQHGYFNHTHPRYNYPKSQTPHSLANYFFVWGEFWTTQADFPIPEKNVIPVGYPFIEHQWKKYRDINSTNQILFLSQKSIGKELSKFAIEVNRSTAIDHNIVYKLHPKEYNNWKQRYPWLTNTNILVVGEDEPPLYKLFAESSIQVGVYSTALFEGLYFDLETYMYDHSNMEYLKELVDNGTAQLVSSADELVSLLGQSKNRFDKETFFAPNSVERITTVLNRIHEKFVK